MLIILCLAIVPTLVICLLCIRVYNKHNNRTCDCSNNLKNKVVVMTGANTGIGLAAAIQLSWKKPSKIIIGCRRVKETEENILNLKKQKLIRKKTQIVCRELDLLSLTSVRTFAESILINEHTVNILVLNAGSGCGFGKKITEDNLEQQFQSNHLSHFLLVNLLQNKLISSAEICDTPSRIIVTSSLAHILGKIDLDNITDASNYVSHPFLNYANTKLANILFTIELDRRLRNADLIKHLTVNCFSPGTVYTNGIRYIEIWYIKWFLKFLCFIYNRSPKEASQNIVHLSLSKELENVSGCYFDNCVISKPAIMIKDKQIAEKLWSVSEKICERHAFKWRKAIKTNLSEKITREKLVQGFINGDSLRFV